MHVSPPHVSHDWPQVDPSEPREYLMCRRCEICTCHSPELSAEPCEFATTEAGA